MDSIAEWQVDFAAIEHFFASNRNFVHQLCQWIQTPKVGGEQFPYDHSVSGMQPQDMNHDNSK